MQERGLDIRAIGCRGMEYTGQIWGIWAGPSAQAPASQDVYGAPSSGYMEQEES